MKYFSKVAGIIALSLAPLAAFAAGASTLNDVFNNIGGVINTATPLVVALALLGFFWGLALYIFGAGDEAKRKKGLPMMVWGIVALFVMLSIFGIVNALQGTLQIGAGTIQPPQIAPLSGN